MKNTAQYRFVVSVLWIGFLLAISFMEAPMKFQAELVTLPIGLSVGKVIFNMLNKIEWVLLGLLLMAEVVALRNRSSTFWVLALLAVLLIQSYWLLPILDARATAIINGALPPASNTHFYYLALEVAKLTMLVLYTRAALVLFHSHIRHQSLPLMKPDIKPG